MLRVACLLGARANPWHAEVLESLPPDIRPTIVGTSRGRYPSDEIALPFIALPWENEVGSWPRRKVLNLRYRLRHRREGFEFALAPGSRLQDFDVLESCELFTAWTRAALDEKERRGVPVVVSVWDNLPGHFAADPRRAPVRERALAEADRFLVLTLRSEAALRLDGVLPERIVRARPSVDAARFRPGADDAPGRAAARLELGAGPGDVLVLSVARLEPMKGIDHLLDGLALGRRREPRLRLAVVGDGGERSRLADRAARLGIGEHVRFVGEAPFRRMPALHGAADVFVLPSVPVPDWQEQWGQSLLEAMASGKGCIASDSGGIPETLGDAGLLVPPADAVAIAEALVRLAADAVLRVELGKRARGRIEAGFTHRDQARVRADLYRALATRTCAAIPGDGALSGEGS